MNHLIFIQQLDQIQGNIDTIVIVIVITGVSLLILSIYLPLNYYITDDVRNVVSELRTCRNASAGTNDKKMQSTDLINNIHSDIEAKNTELASNLPEMSLLDFEQEFIPEGLDWNWNNFNFTDAEILELAKYIVTEDNGWTLQEWDIVNTSPFMILARKVNDTIHYLDCFNLFSWWSIDLNLFILENTIFTTDLLNTVFFIV
jgi:hypothetical protein